MPAIDGLRGLVPKEMKEALEVEARGSTRIVHILPITPTEAAPQPGQGPTTIVIGTLVGLEYTSIANDRAYRVFKIPVTLYGQPRLHIHWTKSGNDNEQGKTVRWQVDYTVYNGQGEDVALVTPTTITFDDTYEDSGTTTRVIHRTATSDVLTDFEVGKYAGVQMRVVAAGTNMTSNPVLITADLSYEELVE